MANPLYDMDPMSIPLSMPLGPPPPGVTSNFEHPSMTYQDRLVATVAVTLTLALIVVLTRLATRIFIVRQFGWDDAVCVLAAALTVTHNVMVLHQIKYGLATANWDQSLRLWLQYKLQGYFAWNAIGSLVYVVTFGVIKLSMLLLYLRIFGLAHNATRIAIWCIFSIVSCVIIAGFFGYLSLCHPVKKLFVYDEPGTCNLNAIGQLLLFQAYMQIFTDIMIAVVPVPMVLKLRMSTLQKIGIIAILANGLVVTVISIIRLVGLYPKSSPRTAVDVHVQYNTNFWSILEVNLAMICASAPALKQFIGHSFPVIRDYASNFTPKLYGLSNSNAPGSNGSGRSKWGPFTGSDRGQGAASGPDVIQHHQDFSITDRRVQDGSYLELGPRTDRLADGSQEYGFGPTTHVTAGEKDVHSSSSREPIVQN